MRYVFLLHGCPNTGKSSLIRRLGVQELTVGYDKTRELFAPLIECAEGVTRRVTAEVDRDVVSATHNMVKTRMDAGATIFFDSTMLSAGDRKPVLKLAAKYGYTPIIVDCQSGVTYDEILRRNDLRPSVEQIARDALDKMWNEAQASTFTEDVEVIKAEDLTLEFLITLMTPATISAPEVVVVGDVHSCAAPLRKALADHDKPERHWVFVGDLFDRGPEPVPVWNFIHNLRAQGRATIVTGNHEKNLRSVNNHTSHSRFTDTRDTRDALLAAGIMAAEQTDFVNSTVPAVFIDYAQHTWLVTHGGVGEDVKARLTAAPHLVHESECIYGVSDRAKAYRGKTSYGELGAMPLASMQFHGHRSGNSWSVSTEVPVVRDNFVVRLESGVTQGGEMSVAVLTSEGLAVYTYPDEMGAPVTTQFAAEAVHTASLRETMASSEFVNMKPVEGFPGIVACNFTREAFQDGAWDDVTVHARGLFLDEAGDVVARGYEKFFHMDEFPGRTEREWHNDRLTAYPVTAVNKANGFLAIVSSVDGRLLVATKSGVTDYSRYAEKVLIDHVGEDGAEQLREMLERTNTSALFEVLSPRDPHPVSDAGDEEKLILLDCVKNQATFETYDKIALGIEKRFGFERCEVIGVAHNPDEFDELIMNVVVDLPTEGAVIRDAAGYRGKLKALGYVARKQSRTALERVWRGKQDTLGPRLTDLESRLKKAGIWGHWENFTVTGVDGSAKFDLARLWDTLEAVESSR